MEKTDRNTGDKRRSPPVKLLSGQLRDGVCTGTSGNIECSVKLKGGSIPVSLVWMQGTVLEAKPDRDTVVLMDETGTFSVNGVNSIPKGKPCLSQGNYVMVMGVIQAASPEPIIRAVKMANLSEDAATHRRMWKLEVEDLQQVLLCMQ